MMGQFFPYPVRDVYGSAHDSGEPRQRRARGLQQPPGAPRRPTWSQSAQANLVVRDGVASFYFHPYHNVAVLQEIVEGIRAAGYTFVGAHDM